MKFYDVLDSIICHNWYCGEITAFYAWSNECTIEDRNDQQKIRRALKKIGYKAHFGAGILNVSKIK